ncbi:TetR/AcrR family transcriptional regulator [Peribacillus acanthi]|uniref:TetR/AcrR family transcriptional regulator n=1 Tax=Peribacillus acanthi TaxID=2171554 RepID=UPI000D3E72CA|nr:TetR/AcrR family transcriptional regulator [Peribacillus acanthi]
MTNQESLEQLLLNDQGENLTDKQRKILEAAIEMFAEKGYASTSTNEIAKKAGVAEGTIFRHYKTKKDLLISIVAPSMAKLLAPFIIQDIYKVLDEKYESPEDFFRAMLKNRRAFLQKNIAIFKIFLQEIPFHPELKEPFMEHVAKKIYTRVEAIIDHYKEKGEIVDLPSPSIIRFVLSVIGGYLISQFIIFPEIQSEEERDDDATIYFLMNGLRPKMDE